MKHLKWVLPLILILALWGYHFLAANQAERDIDQAIQEQAGQLEPAPSIKYESIRIQPFAGDITFHEANIMHDQSIYRFTDARFDLTYWDFLNIYFRGAEAGLAQIERANFDITDFSLVQRDTRTEVNTDSLHSRYDGNLLDGLQTLITGQPTQNRHQYAATAYAFRLNLPQAGAGSLRTDSLHWSSTYPDSSQNLFEQGNHSLDLYAIQWNPPESVTDKYGFFIRGFDYEENNLPFDSLKVEYQSEDEIRKEIAIGLFAEPFDIEGDGFIRLNEQVLRESEIEEYEIALTNPSEQVQNMLANAERMFDFELPRKDGNPVLRLQGPLSDIEMKN